MSSHTSLSDHCKHIKFAESMSIETLASKLLVVMGTYSSKLRSFFCPHFWAKCFMLVTYRYWLSVIVQCALTTGVIKWFLQLHTYVF